MDNELWITILGCDDELTKVIVWDLRQAGLAATHMLWEKLEYSNLEEAHYYTNKLFEEYQISHSPYKLFGYVAQKPLN